VAEDDELADANAVRRVEDNSLGRLLTLADGVFAIAMTLLALDLRVPELSGHPSNHQLARALADNASNFGTYILSFYVVGLYWVRHRRLMRSVVRFHDVLARDTIVLLLIVAAMPFPASLLARYGTTPVALAVYGAVNAAATLMLLLLSHDVRRLDLQDHLATHRPDHFQRWLGFYTLAVFLICIPAAFVLGRHGPWVLTLVAVPNLIAGARKITLRVRAAK
jgi:uncharacterized membrane protein